MRWRADGAIYDRRSMDTGRDRDKLKYNVSAMIEGRAHLPATPELEDRR